jgi:hypothetical protein
MKIVDIFVHLEMSLLAVQYDEHDCDELTRLMSRWNNIYEIREFFKENQQFITNGFFGTISINEAVEITINEAEYIENILLTKAENGTDDKQESLQTIFKPLDDNEYKTSLLQKSKLKGQEKKSWLRIYAIKIGPNTFVITGGGIKLTHKMKDSVDLKDELNKIEITKNHLKKLGVFDENDYELLEL